MKIKNSFDLRQVAGTWVVLPLADATVDFTGMLTLNETGHMLWNLLKDGSDRQALADVDAFIAKLSKAGCIEE